VYFEQNIANNVFVTLKLLLHQSSVSILATQYKWQSNIYVRCNGICTHVRNTAGASNVCMTLSFARHDRLIWMVNPFLWEDHEPSEISTKFQLTLATPLTYTNTSVPPAVHNCRSEMVCHYLWTENVEILRLWRTEHLNGYIL